MKKILIVIGFTVAMSAFGGAHWYWSQSEKVEPKPAENLFTNQPATTTQPIVSKQPTYKGQAVSFLGEPAVMAGYPKEFVDSFNQRLATAIRMIGEFPRDEVYWIELGMIKKTFNNYTGARDAWEHARLLNEKNPVVYNNLGNLYALYLRDFQKAEQYYKKSIDLDPTSAQPYLVLSDFYKDFLKEKSDLADDVLLSGLQKLPNDGGLILNLALYYRSIEDKTLALKYFEKFLKLPGLTGTQQEAVKAEIAALGTGQYQ